MSSPVPDHAAEYQKRKPRYENLRTEAVSALEAKLASAGIRTHAVVSRLKEYDSLMAKAERKEYGDPYDAPDLVGLRVVTLFRSDLRHVRDAIHDLFTVLEEDDRVEGGDPAAFGYMSVHYVATMKERYAGPRYDDIKGLQFEVQVRTIVMDAWDSVSHYLDYKGASSIPRELRRDFLALSGLFYVADQHFELFFSESLDAQQRASADVQDRPEEDVEINLDTVSAFLDRKFPDRTHADRPVVSEFVEEISEIGYTHISQLDEAIDRARAAFLDYEKRYPPSDPDEPREERWLQDVGAARMSLGFADEHYNALKYPRSRTIRPTASAPKETDQDVTS